jgi:hypothetical protein
MRETRQHCCCVCTGWLLVATRPTNGWGIHHSSWWGDSITTVRVHESRSPVSRLRGLTDCTALLCVHRFVAGGNSADAAFQLKSLIKALHAAGIEVLLEVRTWCICLSHLLPRVLNAEC